MLDEADFTIFAANFGRSKGGGSCEGDFDISDNDVVGSDPAVMVADFGRTDCF
jgi:hypothetical protein